MLPGGADVFANDAWVVQDSTKSTNGFKATDTTNLHGLRVQVPDQNGGPAAFSIDAKADGYSVLQLFFGLYQTSPQGVFANFNLTDGAVSLFSGGTVSIFDIGDGWFRCSISVVDNAADLKTQCYAVAVPSPSSVRAFSFLGESAKGLLLRNPQITATPYPVPYTPPGTTMPASNATVTNGSWFALPNGSELWKALDGQADGVELVTNGGFDSAAGWSLASGWAIVDGVLVSSGGANANASIAAPTSFVTGAWYRVNVDITSYNAGELKIGLGGFIYGFVGKAVQSFSVILQASGSTNNIYVNNNSGSFVGSIDNISIQRIQPQPLTLATRVRMGVGSVDLVANAGTLNHYVYAGGYYVQYSYKGGSAVQVVTSFAGTTGATGPVVTWPRNAIIRRVTQVNTAGTQYRVGYMIEGTHTEIQWGSWAAYDGSFNPSTLYRLMLGYANPYPMWFNKIAVWKKQATDAEILEALS